MSVQIKLPRNLPIPMPSGGGGGGGILPPRGTSVGPHIPPNGGGVGPHIPPSGGGVGPHIPRPPETEVGPHIPSPRRRGRTIIDAEGFDVPIYPNSGRVPFWLKALGLLGGGATLGGVLGNISRNQQQQQYPTSPKPTSSGGSGGMHEIEPLPSEQGEAGQEGYVPRPWEATGKPEADPRILGGMSPIAQEQLRYMNSKGMPTADQWSSHVNELLNDPVQKARIAQSMDAQRQAQWNANNRAPTAQETTMGIDKGYLAAERALMRGEITPDQMPIRRGTATQSQMDKAVQNTMRTGIPLGDQYLVPNRQEQQKIGQAHLDRLSSLYDDVMASLNGEGGVSPKKARK